MGFVWAILIGIIAGFLAGKITKGEGFGLVFNLIIGVIGGIVGNFVFSLLGLSTDGKIGSLVMSTAGAVILLWIVSYFKKKR